MKHGQNNRRQRSRNNGRRYPNQRGNSFESNGPEVKVRGTAQQVLEKYQALARDAFSTGDRVLAEGYLQHAEHYYRIMNSDAEGANRDNNNDRDNTSGDSNNNNNRGRGRNRRDNRNDNGADQSADADASSDEQDERKNNNAETVAAKSDAAESTGAQSVTDGEKSNESENATEEEPVRKPRGRRPRRAEPTVQQTADDDSAVNKYLLPTNKNPLFL